MKLDLPKISQAANLALVKACRRLDKAGCNGEAARAWSLADRWRGIAALLITQNADSLRTPSAFKVVRQLSSVLMRKIIEVELSSK